MNCCYDIRIVVKISTGKQKTEKREDTFRNIAASVITEITVTLGKVVLHETEHCRFAHTYL